MGIGDDTKTKRKMEGLGFLSALHKIDSVDWARKSEFVRVISRSLHEFSEVVVEVYDRARRFLDGLKPETEEQRQQRRKELAAANFLATAERRGVPIEKQLHVMNTFRDSPTVLAGAANQRNVPPAVQKQLLSMARDQEEVLLLLAINPNTTMPVLAALTQAPSLVVRQQTARMLAGHMRMQSPDQHWTHERGRAFVTMLTNYDPSFGPDVVPVLDDPATIENLYYTHVNDYRNLPYNAQAFANNPNTPDTVLKNIALNEMLRDNSDPAVQEGRRTAIEVLRNRERFQGHHADHSQGPR